MGVAVGCVLQLSTLFHLLMMRRRSHKSPSAKFLLKGAVCERVKVHGEESVHETGWIVDSEILSVRSPRNNICLSLLVRVSKQSMKTANELTMLFHPIRYSLSVDAHLLADLSLALHQEAVNDGSLLGTRRKANETPARQKIEKAVPVLGKFLKVLRDDFVYESLLVVNVEGDTIGLPGDDIRLDILVEFGLVQHVVEFPWEQQIRHSLVVEALVECESVDGGTVLVRSQDRRRFGSRSLLAVLDDHSSSVSRSTLLLLVGVAVDSSSGFASLVQEGGSLCRGLCSRSSGWLCFLDLRNSWSLLGQLLQLRIQNGRSRGSSSLLLSLQGCRCGHHLRGRCLLWLLLLLLLIHEKLKQTHGCNGVASVGNTIEQRLELKCLLLLLLLLGLCLLKLLLLGFSLCCLLKLLLFRLSLLKQQLSCVIQSQRACRWDSLCLSLDGSRKSRVCGSARDHALASGFYCLSSASHVAAEIRLALLEAVVGKGFPHTIPIHRVFKAPVLELRAELS
mmetsp:Transcript_5771/g.13830  ORF Transcript_5771/g.13830 Transcript_5771/m.13830 type:complete len:507 (-) Transcript_5771:772-2292(-)